MRDLGDSDIGHGSPVILPASAYNDAVDAVRRRAALRPVPPLVRSGSAWMLARPEGFWARLTGASSPYSWVGLAGSSGGAWGDYAGSGEANAYEVNGVAGLGGRPAWLVPGAPGDFRFQHVADGSGSGPDPETCLCWGYDSMPSSLAWSAVWEAADEPFVGPWTSIGTRSGSLSKMTLVSYPDYTGGDVCYPMELDPDPTSTFPDPGVPATGWIGDWTDYCFIPGPGDVSTGTAVARPSCILGNATCAATSGTLCRHLWFVCSPIGAFLGNPGGRAGIGFTYAGIPSGPGAGSGAVRCGGDRMPEYDGNWSLSCGPFAYTITVNVSALLRYTLTITE